MCNLRIYLDIFPLRKTTDTNMSLSIKKWG